MAEGIDFQIVTPEGVKLHEQVSELTAPSVDGEFGVLPGHRPLLAALRTGIVTFTMDQQQRRVVVGPGFVEVADDRALILSDRFKEKEAIDPVRVRLDLKETDEKLEHFTGDPRSPDHQALVEEEAWAAAQLELYGDPPPPTIRTTVYELDAPAGYGEGQAESEGEAESPAEHSKE